MSVASSIVDRREAARVLRAVRTAQLGEADELLDWALSFMPRSRPVQRLKIRRLLDEGDLDAAEALIAQGLLLRPTDPALAFLRARSLAARQRFQEARNELRLALRQRPWHVGVMTLAAEVATQLGDHPQAVQLLERAVSRRPGDDDLKRHLVETLLAADCPTRAEAVLESIRPAPAILKARLLRCQQRPLDALEVLEKAIESTDDVDQRDEQFEALVDLLELIGDASKLRSGIDRIDPQLPLAHLRSGRALLSLGDFHTCTTRAQQLAANALCRREALHTLVVAATETGGHRQARDALCELTAMGTGPNPRRMAECWLRAFKGRMIRRQFSARTAGADPSLKLLPALLTDAVAVFDEQLADRGQPLCEAERSGLQEQRSVCLAGLGRQRDAEAALARSLAGPAA